MAGRMVARELRPTGGYPALPVLRESTAWPWRFTLIDQRLPWSLPYCSWNVIPRPDARP